MLSMLFERSTLRARSRPELCPGAPNNHHSWPCSVANPRLELLQTGLPRGLPWEHSLVIGRRRGLDEGRPPFWPEILPFRSRLTGDPGQPSIRPTPPRLPYRPKPLRPMTAGPASATGLSRHHMETVWGLQRAALGPDPQFPTKPTPQPPLFLRDSPWAVTRACP